MNAGKFKFSFLIYLYTSVYGIIRISYTDFRITPDINKNVRGAKIRNGDRERESNFPRLFLPREGGIAKNKREERRSSSQAKLLMDFVTGP